MAINSDTTKFGALGFKDPGYTVPQVTFARSVDFEATPLETGKYALLPIPAGFLVTSVAVVQKAACDDSVAVTVKTDVSDTTLTSLQLVKSNIVDGVETAVPAAINAPVASGYIASTDYVVIELPDSKKLAKGCVEVFVTGIRPLANTYVAAPDDTPAWRETLQTKDNVSGGQVDPRKYEGPKVAEPNT